VSKECPRCKAKNPDDTAFCGKCGTQLDSDLGPTQTMETPNEELTTGATFAGRYQIIEELGKGGMGRVYKVLDKETNEKIALKLIKPEIASDKKTVERFRNELTTTRKIRHKNICGMYDLGEEKGVHFISMEYVAGEDLKSFIRRSVQLTVGKAISIAKQICDGLAEAHNLGVVHRDLKPSNIMIDKGGNARIMDFGIARAVKGKRITGSGVMIGTPEYMSPEQVEGKGVDQRSDVYSLGIILYEMLTGRVPFVGDTPFTVGVKHKSEMPEDPKEINPQIPDDLSGIILKCLEKDKENRYPSTRSVKSELEKIEQGLPTTESKVLTPSSTTSKQITVSITPKKFIIPLAILAALILAVILIWKPWKGTLSIQPTESGMPSLAVLNFKNNTGDPSLDNWNESIRDLLITDLYQSRYLRIQSAERINQILSMMNLEDETSYSADVLGEIGRKAGVETIITGNFTKSGNLLRLNVSLLDAESGDLINSEKTEGQSEAGYLPLVDDLTHKIKSSFNITEARLSSDQDMEVGAITTSYPEAYRYYREGRSFFLRADFSSSIPLMERAIEIDPNFAMAYRSIAVAYQNMGGNKDKVKEYLGKALEKTDRLSYKEKKIIEAQYSSIVELNLDEAMNIWEELLEDYPEDNFINMSIGATYHKLGELDKAIRHYEVCRKNSSELTTMYTYLGLAYMAIGGYEKAREVYRDHIEYFGDSASMRTNLANAYVFEGMINEALPEANKAMEMNPRAFIMGIFDHIRGDFATAEKDYEHWLDDSNVDMRMMAHRWLACINMTQGKFDRAASFIEEGLTLAKDQEHQIRVLEFLDLKLWCDLALRNFEEAMADAQTMLNHSVEYGGPIYLFRSVWLQSLVLSKMNQSEKIREIIDQMERQLEALRVADWWSNILVLSFKGLADFAEGSYKSAAEKWDKAWIKSEQEWSWTEGIVIHRITRVYNLGEAHLLAGDLESAQKAYEQGLNLTSGKIYLGDLWAKSHFKLGEIYEKLGNRDKAIEHTERFLEMWKDADPGLPEVEDAKNRLERF